MELLGAEAGAMAVGKQRGGEREEGTWWAVGKGLDYVFYIRKLDGGQLHSIRMWIACFKQCGS